MRAALIAVLLAAAAARAQSACEARCHQSASDCLKGCSGDPKEAQKPEQRRQLMVCLDGCERKTQACKAACPRREAPKAPPPGR